MNIPTNSYKYTHYVYTHDVVPVPTARRGVFSVLFVNKTAKRVCYLISCLRFILIKIAAINTLGVRDTYICSSEVNALM